jgi:carbon monoxide dehydrogenase subunit G
VFTIKADCSEQLELKTSMKRAREFFAELNNFVELMPGIESIKNQAGGLKLWTVSADVPMLGSMRAAFPLAQTEDQPELIEWSPAPGEQHNFLRYLVEFEESGAGTLSRVALHVEMRRQKAKELHVLAGLVGEGRISAEMQRYVTMMVKTFLQRALARLEE